MGGRWGLDLSMSSREVICFPWKTDMQHYYERDIRTVELTDWDRLLNLAQSVNKGDPRKVSQLKKLREMTVP